MKPLRIGIAGLGTVGGGVVKLLSAQAELIAARAGRPIVVTAVSARDRGRDRGMSLECFTWHDDPVALADDPDVDVVVELIGGSDGPAKALAEAAIAAGKAACHRQQGPARHAWRGFGHRRRRKPGWRLPMRPPLPAAFPL